MRVVVMGSDPFPPSQDPGVGIALHPETRNAGRHIIHTGGQYDSHILVPVIPALGDPPLRRQHRGRENRVKRWTVLAGCFIGMSVAMPAILLVPLGLFLESVTAEFGWSRTEFSAIVATTSLFNAVAMPAAGYLVDRYGARRVIAAGTLLGCGSYAALALVHSFIGFVALMGVTVMLGNMASYPAFMSLTQRWFDKRLGLALAITSTGLAAGIGGASYAIARTIASRGWRAAFLTVGISALVDRDGEPAAVGSRQ